MGSPALFSNNAPPPIPGGFGNPAGANIGGFGSPTTPSANTGPFGASDFSHLSSGFNTGGWDTNFSNMLGKTYGIGTGSILNNLLTQGLFNPQVASAYLNAMQPGVARGQADILNAFGAGGNRFSSSAALGLGDYESQVNLNQNQILASLFQNAQAEQLGLLGNILPTLHGERANQGGLLSDILGGLEAVGGAIAAPFTGGATIPLIGAGIGTIAGQGKSSQPTGQQSGNDPLTQALQAIYGKLSSGTSSAPTGDAAGGADLFSQLQQGGLTSSAGSLFGGSGGDNSQVPFLPWLTEH